MAIDLFDETMGLWLSSSATVCRTRWPGHWPWRSTASRAPRPTSTSSVRRDDVEATLEVARARGFRVQALPMRFSDGLEVRRSSKVDAPVMLALDLLLVNENLEPVWASRERVATERGDVWVVSRQGLIEMKAWAGREQDLADIRRLRELDR